MCKTTQLVYCSVMKVYSCSLTKLSKQYCERPWSIWNHNNTDARHASLISPAIFFVLKNEWASPRQQHSLPLSLPFCQFPQWLTRDVHTIPPAKGATCITKWKHVSYLCVATSTGQGLKHSFIVRCEWLYDSASSKFNIITRQISHY